MRLTYTKNVDEWGIPLDYLAKMTDKEILDDVVFEDCLAFLEGGEWTIDRELPKEIE